MLTDFERNKVSFPFVNDPAPPLYMATRLWANVFPSRFSTNDFTATTSEIVTVVREQYQHGSTAEIEGGMHILLAAGLASSEKRRTWKVLRSRNLRWAGQEVPSAIARLMLAPPQRTARRPKAQHPPHQDSLFPLPD